MAFQNRLSSPQSSFWDIFASNTANGDTISPWLCFPNGGSIRQVLQSSESHSPLWRRRRNLPHKDRTGDSGRIANDVSRQATNARQDSSNRTPRPRQGILFLPLDSIQLPPPYSFLSYCRRLSACQSRKSLCARPLRHHEENFDPTSRATPKYPLSTRNLRGKTQTSYRANNRIDPENGCSRLVWGNFPYGCL